MTSYETRRKQFIEQLAIVRNDSLKVQKQFRLPHACLATELRRHQCHFHSHQMITLID